LTLEPTDTADRVDVPHTLDETFDARVPRRTVVSASEPPCELRLVDFDQFGLLEGDDGGRLCRVFQERISPNISSSVRVAVRLGLSQPGASPKPADWACSPLESVRQPRGRDPAGD
jgi:hypothetical protein